MRLLRLVFTNVNSLSGTHSINFEDRAFTDHGIFTITGPTGSGKSSILDAVSLALFGSTPRQEAGSGIGAGECIELTKGRSVISSVVEFSVDGVRYSSSWRRTTAKRSGRLSAAQVELRNLDSGEVLASSKREWDAKITETTGMTFETFTRTMLLAQGAFAEFLKSSVDKRSQILEKATGTEIYTKIGKRIFEKKKEAEEEVARLADKAEEVVILSEEDRRSAAARLEELDEEIRRSRTKLASARALLSAAEKRREARKAKDELDKKIAAWKLQLEQLAPEVSKAQSDNQIRVLVREKKNAVEAARLSIEARIHLDSKIKEVETAVKTLESASAELAQAEKARDELVDLEKELRKGSDEQKRLAKDAETARTIAESMEGSLKADIAMIEDKRRELELKRIRLKEAEQRKIKISEKLKSRSFSSDEVGALAVASSRFEDASRFDFAGGVAKLQTKEAELNDSERRLQEKRREALGVQDRISILSTQADDLSSAVEECSNPDASAALKKAAAGVVVKTAEPVLEAAAKALCGRPEARDIEALLNSWREFDGTKKGYEAALELLEAKGAQLAQTKSDLVRLRSEIDELIRRRADLDGQADREAALHEALQKERCLINEEISRGRSEFEESWRDLLDVLGLPHKEYADELRLTVGEKILDVRKAVDERRRDEAEHLKVEAEVESLILSCSDLEKDLSSLSGAADSRRVKKTEALDRLAQVEAELERKFSGSDLIAMHIDAESRLKDSEIQVRNKASARQSAESNLKRLEGECEVLKENARSCSEKSAAAEENLKNLLASAGFADVDEDAELYSQEKADSIINEAQKLDAEIKASAQISGRLQVDIDELSRIQIDEDSVRASISDIEEMSAELNQEMGRQRKVLEDDDRSRVRFGSIAAELEAKRKSAALWVELYEKIAGRSDGEAFRKATQKYTFSLLLGAANKIMRGINPRYTLCAAGPDMLNLEVSDLAYGLKRTADNLSGGETFIVSLALALALSSMSSAKRRIDTLFLDEGFGSLDDDTLHAVLGTLDKLHKGSGRLIGLISHVPQVKERISDSGGAQILVERIRNSGESRLSGDGVSWREDASR